jgi:hypothetical protein
VHYENVTLGALYNFINVGNDLRFRVGLITNDQDKTPIIKDLAIDYVIEYYDSAGELISSTFNLGADPTFTTLAWQPSSQPAEAGNESLKFQIASNSDNATWNFIGPDGTAATYYLISNAALHSSHNGHQYLRYKIFLNTSDVAYTPKLNSVLLGYTLSCLAPGQAFFNNLDNDTYTLDVGLTGYQSVNQSIDVNGYTKEEIVLTP